MNSQEQVTFWSVVSGDARQQILDMAAENKRALQDLDARKNALDNISDPVVKVTAQKLYAAGMDSFNKQYGQFVQAREKYNTIATQIRTVTGGLYKPELVAGTLSGMGFLPAIPVAIEVALVAAGVIIALNELVNLVGAWKGQSNATRGYIDQLSDAMKSGGQAVVDVGSGLQKVAWAAAIGLGVYMAFQWARNRRSSSTVSSAPAIDVQPLSVEVSHAA